MSDFIIIAKNLLDADYRFAKTMKKHPHNYTLRESWRNKKLFDKVAKYIRANSYPEKFYSNWFKMFPLNGYKYWTMSNHPVLINRAKREIKSDYNKIADEYLELFTDKESLEENKEVFSKIDVRGDVLDIGCGAGLTLDYKDIKPSNYIGIDPSSKMLKKFIEQYPNYEDSLVCSEFENFYMGRFDTIISTFGSMNYVKPDAIERIWKTLRLGGKAYLMFYKGDYEPITHIKTGINPYYYNHDIKGGEYIGNYKLIIIKK